MRLRHLNDFEIQGMLDRRSSAPASNVPGETYLKDLEAQEHLDSCPECLGEVELYRELFCDLSEPTVNFLPRNFARKVTFCLPPFKALRTRARLQLAAAWGSALLLALLWFLSKLDWQGLFAKAGLVLVPRYVAVENWITSTISSFSLPEFSWPELWPPLAALLESFQGAFLTEGGPANLIILAAIALLLVASLDRLYVNSMHHQHERR